MKKTFLCLACLAVLLICARPAAALDTTWDPGSMPLGIDARSFGMGGACLAVVDSYFTPANPAALSYLTAQGVYIGRFVNPPYDPFIGLGDQTEIYASYVHPAEGMGAYAVTLYSNEYLNRFIIDEDVDHVISEFTGIQYSYAHAFTDHFSLGFSIRWLSVADTTYEYSSDTLTEWRNKFFTADLGAVFKIGEAITASVLITDILSPEVVYSDTVGYFYEIEPRILFGGSFTLGEMFLFALDVDYNIDSEDDLLDMTRVGVEFRPVRFLAFRAGSYHGDLTVGFGFVLGNREDIEICLDYGQRWEDNNDEIVSNVQCMQMTVYF